MNDSLAPAPAGDAVARIVSIVLHPFAVFAALAMIATIVLAPAAWPRTLMGMAVVVAVAWGFVWQRRRSGRWGTVDASHPRERPALYFVVLVLLAGYWWWMRGSVAPLAQGVLAVVAMLCVAAWLNRWIKVSLHMASLAYAGVALLSLHVPAAVVALGMLPLLAWARLRMRRHTPAEVLAGCALGVAAAVALRWLAR